MVVAAVIPRDAHVLVIAAHPDDEVLGAGGFMAHHPGCSVAIVSEGTSSEHSDPGYYTVLAAKRAATQRAAVALSFVVVREGDFPDQQLAFTRALQEWVEAVVVETRPDVVLTHRPTELNRDHRVVSEAVQVACRPYCQTGKAVRLLLGYPVDPLGFPTPRYIAGALTLPLTEGELSQKLLACQAYAEAGAFRDWPHPRSLRAVETHARATGHAVGVPAAEAYELLWGLL